MTIRLEELRRRADALAGELADIRESIANEEASRFVQVKFIGNPKIYTYELAPGHEAKSGDYLCVWSPMTAREELVRVYALGRGSTLRGHSLKIAKQVQIDVRRPVDNGQELSLGQMYVRFRELD